MSDETKPNETHTYHSLRTIAAMTAELLHRDVFLPPRPHIGVEIDVQTAGQSSIEKGKAILRVDDTQVMEIRHIYADNWDPASASFVDFDYEHVELLDEVARLYRPVAGSFFSGFRAVTGRGSTTIGGSLDDHEAFLAEEARKYHSFFHETSDRGVDESGGSKGFFERGIVPSSALESGQGGYVIALRYPAFVTDPIAEFSEKIAKVVPAVTYDGDNIHTTIGTAGIVNEEFEPDKEVLKKLVEEVASLTRNDQVIRQLPPTMKHGEWMYSDSQNRTNKSYSRSCLVNSDSVVLPNASNQFFTRLVEEISDLSIKGVDLHSATMAHISVARFKEARDSMELDDLLGVLENAPEFGSSMPDVVDVGYFNLDNNGFRFNTIERFHLL